METPLDNHESPNSVALAPGVSVPESLLEFTFVRSSGPGGQHVNKLNTAATLRVSAGDLARETGLSEEATARLRRLAGRRLTADDMIILRCEAHRSQLQNRRGCLERLGDLVLTAKAVPKKRKPTKPTRGAKERRLDAKRQQGRKKQRRSWSGEE
ncbi:MAG: aminoacyl-tRNA hydrolase [Phycisphaerales bacterium]|nr:aminoacyl-tRNA hydrolase [Phycisphaerales bacterium]